MLKLFMMLCIVECRTFSDTNVHICYFNFIFYCILFYDFCVLPVRVHGCAWQLLIKKSDDADDGWMKFVYEW